MKYFLDTNIYVYLNNKKSDNIAPKMVEIGETNIKIPSVVAAEMLHGAEKSAKVDFNLKRAKDFISHHEIVSFDLKAAEYYAKIRANLERKGAVIGNNDMFIAATVIANNGILVTHNTREFERIDGLILEDWF